MDVIDDIILKTRQYGWKKMKKVFDIVARKNIDNPTRSYIYVTGVLEQIGGGSIAVTLEGLGKLLQNFVDKLSIFVDNVKHEIHTQIFGRKNSPYA